MERLFMKELIKWKQIEKDRKPMLLYGARQTGKTYLLKEFGEREYKQMVYVNLEREDLLREFFSMTLDPNRLISYLEDYYHCTITPNDTLIILDEIQTCPKAISALKYFCEDTNEIHIIGAGSLLGVAIHREHVSFPVGKVWMHTLYPMDFEEFLIALDETLLLKLIQDCVKTKQPLPQSMHIQATLRYRQYVLCGGMPGVVSLYIEKGLKAASELQSLIIESYLADMSKYASNSETIKIRKAYRSIPEQLSKENHKFKFKLIESGASSTRYGDAIEWLMDSGIILRANKLKNDFLPAQAFCESSFFKIYMSDVGLLSNLYHLDFDGLSQGEYAIFQGGISENYVAQQLHSYGYELYYYESNGKAELDFMVQIPHGLIPLEVKAGINTKSKSLQVYRQKYQPPLSIRCSLKEIGFQDGLLSLPLYALFVLKNPKEYLLI